MPIPPNVLVNADDLGLSTNVNNAILFCYQAGYINSSSVLTNTSGFEHCVELIRQNPVMVNLGVHINLAEGRPLTAMPEEYLDEKGCWDVKKTGRVINYFSTHNRRLFKSEISAQISCALDNNLSVTHLDSHYHLHTLPGFYNLFISLAQRYKLQLRLAQTYNEGNYLKYLVRRYINYCMISKKVNYTTYFETVDMFLTNGHINRAGNTEIMLHPTFDDKGNLTDHYDPDSMINWLKYLNTGLKNGSGIYPLL